MIPQGAGGHKGWEAALKAGGSSVMLVTLSHLHTVVGLIVTQQKSMFTS